MHMTHTVHMSEFVRMSISTCQNLEAIRISRCQNLEANDLWYIYAYEHTDRT